MKPPSDTDIETTHLVQPPNTNLHGTAFGGWIMAQMDLISAICAKRHTQLPCVTVCVDDLQFNRPIRVGDIVVMKARVNRTWNSSLEIGVKVVKQNPSGKTKKCLSGFFTFVALDEDGSPVEVPKVEPATDKEKQRAAEADQRKADRLARKK